VATATTTGIGCPVSTAATRAVIAAANIATITSSGRLGPIRSITRPWATEPAATPIICPADTTPAAANDPVARWT